MVHEGATPRAVGISARYNKLASLVKELLVAALDAT